VSRIWAFIVYRAVKARRPGACGARRADQNADHGGERVFDVYEGKVSRPRQEFRRLFQSTMAASLETSDAIRRSRRSAAQIVGLKLSKKTGGGAAV